MGGAFRCPGGGTTRPHMLARMALSEKWKGDGKDEVEAGGVGTEEGAGGEKGEWTGGWALGGEGSRRRHQVGGGGAWVVAGVGSGWGWGWGSEGRRRGVWRLSGSAMR